MLFKTIFFLKKKCDKKKIFLFFSILTLNLFSDRIPQSIDIYISFWADIFKLNMDKMKSLLWMRDAKPC